MKISTKWASSSPLVASNSTLSCLLLLLLLLWSNWSRETANVDNGLGEELQEEIRGAEDSDTINSRHIVFEEDVEMSSEDSHQIGNDLAAHQQMQRHQSPWKVFGRNGLNWNEWQVQRVVGIESTPDIDEEHEKREAQICQRDEICSDGHDKATENVHPDKICSATSEMFFKTRIVLEKEDEIQDERKTEIAEKEEIGEEAPNLRGRPGKYRSKVKPKVFQRIEQSE